jgi:hypothetical protein
MLIQDVPNELMTHMPSSGLVNHPAFTIGHLVSASAMLVEDLGGEQELPVGWEALFVRKGPGDPRYPNPDREVYPQKEALIRELERQHNRVDKAMRTISDKQLNTAFEWRFKKQFPSLMDMLHFMCVNHEAMHLGQLAAWRRAMGLPSALAKL